MEMTFSEGFVMNPKPQLSPCLSLTGFKSTEMTKQMDYLNDSLCFMAHKNNQMCFKVFPILVASHDKSRNRIIIKGCVSTKLIHFIHGDTIDLYISTFAVLKNSPTYQLKWLAVISTSLQELTLKGVAKLAASFGKCLWALS